MFYKQHAHAPLPKMREFFFDVNSMAIPVVEFSREGYKTRKVFGKKSTVVK
jgi:hypothetical protein